MKDSKRDKLRLIESSRLLIKIRWFYATAITLTGLFSKIFGAESANQNFSPLVMALFIILGGYGSNLIYYLFFLSADKRPFETVRLVSFIQIFVDIVLLILIVFLAGGIISVSFIYFAFAIIASGFFYGWVGIILITSIVSILYGGLIWGQFFDIFPYLPRYNDVFEYNLSKNLAAVIPNTFTIIASFCMIGAFVGFFSKNIKKKENALIIQKDKESAIISNLSDGIINLNKENKIDVINRRAENILSVAASGVKGKSLKELDGKKYKDLVSLLSFKASEGGDFKLPSNPDLIYSVLINSITDENGKVVGKVITIHDVSQEKFSDAVKSEFITIASHQLRTPLTGIKGALDLLRSGAYGEVNKEQEAALAQGYESSERLASVIDDLLSASSIEASKYNYDYKDVDILGLLKGLGERFVGAAEKRGIKVTVDILNNISKASLDPDKIRLALGSIINNAIKYSRDGCEVNIKCAFDNKNKVLITVKDGGIGIPKNVQDKIFTKFFRANNALKANTEGNGLDLYVAKTIIKNHNGRIWFDSEVDKGTTFFIELKIKPFTKP